MKTTTKQTVREIRHNEALAAQRHWNEAGAMYRAEGKLEEARMCGDIAFSYQVKARKFEE